MKKVRDYHFTMRMDKAEINYIIEQCEYQGINKAEFIRNLLSMYKSIKRGK